MELKQFVKRLENVRGSFWQWLVAILAFCFLRRLLDLLLEADSYKTLVAGNIIRNYIL